MLGMRFHMSRWIGHARGGASSARLRRHRVRGHDGWEPLEDRALLSYVGVSAPDTVTARSPFDVTAVVYNDDGSVDTNFDGSFNLDADSYWKYLVRWRDVIPSSASILSVTTDAGVSTIRMVVDPAPYFGLALSANVVNPDGSMTTTNSTQFAVNVSGLPDAFTFLQPPPDTVVEGTPFSLSVAALGPSGEVDTSFDGDVILEKGGACCGNPPADIWIGSASNGVATFTDLTVGGATSPDDPAGFYLWTPDIQGVRFTMNIIGTATLLWASRAVGPPPDGQVIAGQPFRVAGLALDSWGKGAIGFNGEVTVALANNPTGAQLGGTLTVSAVDGVARFQDLTIDRPGTGYTLQVSSPGLFDATTPAFDVQTTVGVSGAAWGQRVAPLSTASDGLRLLPQGRSTDLPWQGVQTVYINLGQAVPLGPTDVSVLGSKLDYGPVTISGSGTDYTITLHRPINVADRVTITIGNALIASYTRRIDVLPGDLNDDGMVNSQDMVGIRNQIIGYAGAMPTLLGDINGDGVVDINDYSAARLWLGTRLPRS
jgi:hypothetical protein